MKTDYSTQWKSSVQPRKQRKYAMNAPVHIRSKMMGSHLSKDLIKKYGQRTVRVRVGDRVKILRGQFKGKLAKVEEVNVTKQKLYLEKIEVSKKDGSKARYPVHPSNVVVVELNLTDKLRKAKLTKQAAPAKKAEPKAEPKAEAKAKPEQKPKKEENKSE